MVGDVLISTVISILFARRMLLLNASLHENAPIQRTPSTLSMDSNVSHSVKSMKSLSTSRKSSHGHGVFETILDDSTWTMLQRSTLLTFITLFTSQIAIGLGAVLKLEALWTAVDSMVNCWCVMLIFVVHDGFYNKCCGKMQNKIVTVGFMRCWSCNCCCRISGGDDGELESRMRSMSESYLSEQRKNTKRKDSRHEHEEVPNTPISPSTPGTTTNTNTAKTDGHPDLVETKIVYAADEHPDFVGTVEV